MNDQSGATSYDELGEGETLLETPSSELLFRQIPGHLWDRNTRRPSLHAFGPQSADKGMPSYSRETVTTAQDSRDWHNANAKSESKSVWACSVDEVHSAGTRTIDDSAAPVEPGSQRSPGHAYVDFRHLDKGAERQIRASLFHFAIKRDEIPTAP